MKILLIGKYPPMQGGISAKTFWLYSHLQKQGFEFKIVTLKKSHYEIPHSKFDDSVVVINDKKIPWHIPETNLIDDRIINVALKIAKNFDPDLIETNYLWPFCKDALVISKILKKPLLVRHAGSDIQKFYNDEEFKEIINFYFNEAVAIVTNITSSHLLNKMHINTDKIFCLQRYIPDPEIFSPNKKNKTFDILFTGKINYHWRQKGLVQLLQVIKRNKLRALFIIDGNYKDEILNMISTEKLNSYIEIIDFISPDKMPNIYNSCRFVWCWEDKGVVEDFSNLIWEAIFCNIPCIFNSDVAGKIKKEGIDKSFDSLLYSMNEEELIDFKFSHHNISSNETQNLKVHIFDNYIKANTELYGKLIN